MKKIISISVIALFAMIPTFGWAAFDGVASGSTDERVTETVPTNNSTTTYVTTRSSEADNDLTAAHGFQRAGAGVESIVTSQEPKFNVTQITERDGTDVSALSFVKGAYNDAITKINKVYEIKEQTAGKFKLNTTWDGDNNDVIKVSLITVNNVPKEWTGTCMSDYYTIEEDFGDGQYVCAHIADQGPCAEYGDEYYPVINVWEYNGIITSEKHECRVVFEDNSDNGYDISGDNKIVLD